GTDAGCARIPPPARAECRNRAAAHTARRAPRERASSSARHRRANPQPPVCHWLPYCGSALSWRSDELGRAPRLPTHQFLGGLFVVFEESAVVLALDDLRVERQRLGLGLMLLRADGLLPLPAQRRLHVLRQAGRRRDAARHRPHLIESLLAERRSVGNKRRARG